jgi:hypothetical protein
VLEAHVGDDVLTVLIQPLRSPQEQPGVVISGNPELAVSPVAVVLDELDAVPDTRLHSIGTCRLLWLIEHGDKPVGHAGECCCHLSHGLF